MESLTTPVQEKQYLSTSGVLKYHRRMRPGFGSSKSLVAKLMFASAIVVTVFIGFEILRSSSTPSYFLFYSGQSEAMVVLLNTIVTVLISGFAFVIKGKMLRQVAAMLLLALGMHSALLSLPIVRANHENIYLSAAGLLATASLGTFIIVARYMRRRTIAGFIVEGFSLQDHSQFKHRVHVIDNPDYDPSEFYLIVVDQDVLSDPKWTTFLNRAMTSGCEVQSLARFLRLNNGRIPLDQISTIVSGQSSSRLYQTMKRTIDLVLVLLAAPMALVLMTLSALGILIAMGRPILFVQERVGFNGAVFRMYKLRTMRVQTCGEPQIATAKGDDRITPLGRTLRRYHLDELPQLWNVLKGDMALIGPRPEQPDLVMNYAASLPGYGLRHLVRPGISGWSQVKFGYASTLEETREKLEYDLFYVEQCSPLLDAKIFLKTALIMLDPKHVR